MVSSPLLSAHMRAFLLENVSTDVAILNTAGLGGEGSAKGDEDFIAAFNNGDANPFSIAGVNICFH